MSQTYPLSAPTSGECSLELLATQSILVVDSNERSIEQLSIALSGRCALLDFVSTVSEAITLHDRCHFDVLIVDVSTMGHELIRWVRRLRKQGSAFHVIYMSDEHRLREAIDAIEIGIDEFILKPFRQERLLSIICQSVKWQRAERENQLLKWQLLRFPMDDSIIGNSSTINYLQSQIDRCATASSTVLIEGETGVGKEMVGRLIHVGSRRRGAFLTYQCAAKSPKQIVMDLFGDCGAKGPGCEGLVVQADEGTLFLDEVDSLSSELQLKLLRLLEERVTRPEGVQRHIPINVRIIASISSPLSPQVEQGKFRQDLYMRLSVMPIRVLPLRERREDIPLLVKHFSRRFSAELGLPDVMPTASQMHALQRYAWPGNIRELRTVVERMVLLGQLPQETIMQLVGEDTPPESGYPLDWDLKRVEKSHIQKVLMEEGGNKSAAARLLGISRKTLERKQREWDLL